MAGVWGAGVDSGRGESGVLTSEVCSVRVNKARLCMNHVLAGHHALSY